jgi:hypothetical protein
VGNSRGARKLARTPHVNQKKKKKKEKGRKEQCNKNLGLGFKNLRILEF